MRARKDKMNIYKKKKIMFIKKFLIANAVFTTFEQSILLFMYVHLERQVLLSIIFFFFFTAKNTIVPTEVDSRLWS